MCIQRSQGGVIQRGAWRMLILPYALRELLDEQSSLTRDDSTAGLSIETVQGGRFTGQVIRGGEPIVYAPRPGAFRV